MATDRDDEAGAARAEAVKKLILDYQNGDRRAFNRLLDTHQYWQYIFKALRFSGVAEAEAKDYTQQICLRLMNGLKKFRFECPFESYLSLIIRNQLINHYRRHRKLENGVEFKLQFLSLEQAVASDDREQSFIVQLPNPNTSLPDAEMQFKELSRVVGECLKTFKNKTVKVITSMWLDGLKQREIAELSGLSLGAVGGYLFRGQKRLRYCVKKNYF